MRKTKTAAVFRPAVFVLLLLLLPLAPFGYAADGPPPVVTLPPGERVPHQLFAADAQPAGPDWGVIAVKAPEAWAKTKGKGVTVAVLDTGRPNHPDLSVKLAKDFTGSRTGPDDKEGHSTHCCGSIAGRGRLPGVAPEADLIAAKVLDDGGSGGVDGIAAGIRWAADQGADIESLSLGGPGRDSFIPPALEYAESLGVIVIVAAGNEGPGEGTVGYPGGYSKAVAIAAVDSSLTVARFSSRGPAVFVSGPGVNIRSTYLNGQYATMSGTSMATPHVAGLAALWVAAHPEIPKKERPKRFREALIAASKDLPPTGRDTATGYGFPDATKLTDGASIPPVKPPVEPPSLEDRVKELERRVGELEKRFSAPVPEPMPAAPPGMTPPGPGFAWRDLPGVGPGWVHESVTASPAVAPALPPGASDFAPFGLSPRGCPGGTCYQRR